MSALTGSHVFFRSANADEGPPFLRGRVARVGCDAKLLIIPESSSDQISLSREDVYPCSPNTGALGRSLIDPLAFKQAQASFCLTFSGAEGVPDNAQLFYLDEANLLDNVAKRYQGDSIYTYTGTVLLAVNPYRSLDDLYNEATMDSYRGRALGVKPPHVYAIAERARRMLVTEKADQSIIVSGEVPEDGA